jgi:hypothetical protein
LTIFSNIFKRFHTFFDGFYTTFDRFYTFFQIFLQFSTVFTLFQLYANKPLSCRSLGEGGPAVDTFEAILRKNLRKFPLA